MRPRLQLGNEQSDVIQAYVSLCVEIGWLCAVHDPPVSLDANVTDTFDTNKFNVYKKHGKYVEFVVWPVMYLYKEGPLLSKGVAKGNDMRRVNQTDVYLSAVPGRRLTHPERMYHEIYTRSARPHKKLTVKDIIP